MKIMSAAMSVMGLFIFGAIVQILITILDPADAESLIYIVDANFLFIVQNIGWLVFGIGAGAILYDILTSGKRLTY